MPKDEYVYYVVQKHWNVNICELLLGICAGILYITGFPIALRSMNISLIAGEIVVMFVGWHFIFRAVRREKMKIPLIRERTKRR